MLYKLQFDLNAVGYIFSLSLSHFVHFFHFNLFIIHSGCVTSAVIVVVAVVAVVVVTTTNWFAIFFYASHPSISFTFSLLFMENQKLFNMLCVVFVHIAGTNIWSSFFYINDHQNSMHFD